MKTIKDTAAKIFNTVVDALAGRDELASQRAELQADHETAAAARAAELAEARRALEEWEAPLRRVRLLERQDLDARLVEGRARDVLEAALRAAPVPGEVKVLRALADQVVRVLGGEPLRAVTERNQGGDRFERPWTTVAPDAPRRARLLETITRVRIWERDELPWLTTEAARRGALELRQAIEADL